MRKAKKVVALRYIDSIYSYKKTEGVSFIPNITIGKIISSTKDHVTISFSEKDGVAQEGLTIPKMAIFLKGNKIIEQPFTRQNSDKQKIGVFWKDVVYWHNGIIPPEPTTTYTEGELFLLTDDLVIVYKPETILIKKKVKNHPKMKALFYAIPKVLITYIKYYDKK